MGRRRKRKKKVYKRKGCIPCMPNYNAQAFRLAAKALNCGSIFPYLLSESLLLPWLLYHTPFQTQAKPQNSIFEHEENKLKEETAKANRCKPNSNRLWARSLEDLLVDEVQFVLQMQCIRSSAVRQRLSLLMLISMSLKLSLGRRKHEESH
jgi:hypothetical protein